MYYVFDSRMFAHAYKTTSCAALRGCTDESSDDQVCISKITPSAHANFSVFFCVGHSSLE